MPFRKTGSNPNSQSPAKFQFCSILVVNGDHYVGKIATHRFIGNRLTVILSPHIEVRTVTQEACPDEWQEIRRQDAYEHEFEGCRVTHPETDRNELIVISAEGDKITLSNEEDLRKRIEKIISPVSSSA